MSQADRYNEEFYLRLCATTFLFVFCFDKLTATVADPDLWGYMAFGRHFWETGEFLYQDIFSYVPTLNAWIYHEWLTGAIFYPLFKTFGAPGLQLLKYGAGFATIGLVYLTARQRGAYILSAAFGAFVTIEFLRTGYSPVRAQIFTYFFFSLTLFLLERVKQTKRWEFLALLLPVYIFWANAHGGFLAGLCLIGLFALGEMLSGRPSWAYWALLLLAAMVTLFNPYGLDYWWYLIRAISLPRDMIIEWKSVFQAFWIYALLLGVIQFLLLSFLGLMWFYRCPELTGGLILASTFLLACKHVRHIVFFSLVAGVYLPDLFNYYVDHMKASQKLNNFRHQIGYKVPLIVVMCATFYFAFHSLSQGPLALKTPPKTGSSREVMYYPVGALEFIRKNQWNGNLLVNFAWGEYAMWELYPSVRVALDGRFETVYPTEVTNAYFDFLRGKANWRDFLARYPHHMVLLDNRLPVSKFMQSEPGWRQVYADTGSVLFVSINNIDAPISFDKP
jgi:hypothetical protein